MRRVLLVVVVVAIAGWLGYLYAPRLRGARPPVGGQPNQGELPPTHTASDGAIVGKGCDDLAHSIRAVLSRLGPMPEGTRLVSINMSGTQCIIELSSEFGAVNQQGTTGEAGAQNALRAALAAFPRVQTIKVLVDGAVFEGSHSGEWDAVPVKDATTASDNGA